MTNLDDITSYAVDSSGMFGHIARLGDELWSAWLRSSAVETPAASFDNIVIAGMGGSAAAADYFGAHSAKESLFPVEIVRGYKLPGYVGHRTLFIALSYSGGTEETLACYAAAKARGASLIAISNGGELADRAAADGVAWHGINYAAPPRAALGHALAVLLRIGQRLGMNSLCDPDMRAVVDAHRQLVSDHLGVDVPSNRNAAKQLAALLGGASPLLIFAAEHLAPVGMRTKNQFAENAKQLAMFEEVPEATHNVIVGLETTTGGAVGIAFESSSVSEANRRRVALLGQLFEEAGGALTVLRGRGISRLADMFEATAWGDYLSCYLAVLREIDPTPTPALDRMRAAVAQQEAK